MKDDKQFSKEQELLNKHKAHVLEMRRKLIKVFEEANAIFIRSDQASDKIASEIFEDLKYLIHVKL